MKRFLCRRSGSVQPVPTGGDVSEETSGRSDIAVPGGVPAIQIDGQECPSYGMDASDGEADLPAGSFRFGLRALLLVVTLCAAAAALARFEPWLGLTLILVQGTGAGVAAWFGGSRSNWSRGLLYGFIFGFLGLLGGFFSYRLLWGPGPLATPLSVGCAWFGALLGGGVIRWKHRFRQIPGRVFRVCAAAAIGLVISFGIWLSFHLSAISREMRAAEQVAEFGSVIYDDMRPSTKRRARVVRDPFWDHWRRRVGLARVHTVELRDTNVDDGTVESLAAITSLRRLIFYRCPVTDAHAARIAHLKRLEDLWLTSSNITDDGLRHIASLRNLRFLCVSDTRVTGDGLRWIVDLPNLRRLHVFGTAVDDGDVPQLSRLREVETLDLRQTRVTQSGVDRLRRALPNTRIDY